MRMPICLCVLMCLVMSKRLCVDVLSLYACCELHVRVCGHAHAFSL